MHLQEIAEAVHADDFYLSRMFKRDTGETLTEAITSIRLEKAKELLLKTDLKVYEIALSAGIEDPAYFSQLINLAAYRGNIFLNIRHMPHLLYNRNNLVLFEYYIID
jgi:AraC-like DNA-binding protein